MMRWIHRTAAALMILQGIGHTFVGTPMVYDSVMQDALWFAAAGLAMIYLGLLNLKSGDEAPARGGMFIVVANLLWVVFTALLLTTSHSGRVVSAVVLAAICLIGSAWPHRQNPVGGMRECRRE